MTELILDAEWRVKLQEEHYKRQAESDRADWAESELEALKKREGIK